MDEKKTSGKGKLSLDVCALFCEQVAMILNAGIPLYDGMEALAESFADTRDGHIFKQVDEDVKRTGSLYEAVRDAGQFPGYLVGMVRIGEQTGKLDTVMRALGVYYAREDAIRRSIRQAVAYPLGLIAMMALIIAVLVSRVMPIFDRVYASLGASIAPSTSAVIRFGVAAGKVALVLVAVSVLVALALALLSRTNRREAVMRLLTRCLPRIRRFTDMLSASRFSSAMSLMLAGGYPLEESVGMLPDVFDGKSAREKIERMKASLGEGAPFADAVERAHIFEPLHVKMLRVGMLAGQTDQVLEKLSAIYSESLDEEITGLVGTIEPTMVALLSIVIGAILLSVMLPLVGIMASIA